MKKPIIFLAAITLSSGVFADNMHESNGGASMDGDMSSMHSKMKSMHKNMTSMHGGADEKLTQSDILKNKRMQRLHKEMTLSGMSEVGMEARRNMMTAKGKAYHRSLKKSGK